MKTRILVASDREMMRRIVVRMLEEAHDVAIVAQCETGHEAVLRSLALQPDIAILERNLPGLNGLMAAHKILEKSPTTEILILNNQEGEDLVSDPRWRGIKAYLLKSEISSHLLAAVESLRQHKPFLRSWVVQAAPHEFC